jgi:hypothetical protein
MYERKMFCYRFSSPAFSKVPSKNSATDIKHNNKNEIELESLLLIHE